MRGRLNRMKSEVRMGLTCRRLMAQGLILVFICGFSPPCAASENTPRSVSHRLAMEAAADENPFLLVPHRPNFILPISYNVHPNAKVLGLSDGDLDKLEMFFQVSLKLRIDEDFIGTGGSSLRRLHQQVLVAGLQCVPVQPLPRDKPRTGDVSAL